MERKKYLFFEEDFVWSKIKQSQDIQAEVKEKVLDSLLHIGSTRRRSEADTQSQFSLAEKGLHGVGGVGIRWDRKVKKIIKSAEQALITYWGKAHVLSLLTFSHPWGLSVPFFCSEVWPSSVMRASCLPSLTRLAVSVKKYLYLKFPHSSVMLHINCSYKACQFVLCHFVTCVPAVEALGMC